MNDNFNSKKKKKLGEFPPVFPSTEFYLLPNNWNKWKMLWADHVFFFHPN